jgi:hypothetical protein
MVAGRKLFENDGCANRVEGNAETHSRRKAYSMWAWLLFFTVFIMNTSPQ